MLRMKEEVAVFISELWWITISRMRQAAEEKGRATKLLGGSLYGKGFFRDRQVWGRQGVGQRMTRVFGG